MVAGSAILLGPFCWILSLSFDTQSLVLGGLSAGAGAVIMVLRKGLPKPMGERALDFSLGLLIAMAFLATTMVGHSSAQITMALAAICVLGSTQFSWPRPMVAIFYGALVAIWFGAHHTYGTDIDLGNVGFLGAVIALGWFSARSKLRLNAAAEAVVQSVANTAAAERVSAGELKEMDRLKTGFYTSIVEGLRGPLTLMLSPLDSMLSGDVGSFRANQIEYLETVRRNALKVLRLSDDLVDLSHLESGLLRLQSEDTNLVGLLQGVVDHAQMAADSKGIQIGMTADEADILIAVDVEKLERAVTHLVSTAIQYTSQGGKVSLHVYPHDDGANIIIADNGAGLPPDWLQAIGPSDTTRKWLPPRSPEGVGLILAREIVAQHNGQFSVVSRLETGTTFTISLPRGAESGPVTQPHADARTERIRGGDAYRFGALDDVSLAPEVEHAPSESKATKVLIVDDNPEILQFTKSLLSHEHAVFVASNGEAGLALAKREQPDVIITDTRMPKLDGVGLIRALREDPRLAAVPTIILTARNQVADREAARESGADLVMDKPFNPRELRAAISELFAKQHRQASTFMNEQARSFEIISAGLAHEMHNPLAYIKNAFFVIGENAHKVVEAAKDPELSVEERDKRFDKAREKIDKMLPIADRGIKKVEQLVALMRRYAREGYSSDAVELPIDQCISDVLAMIAPKDNKEVTIEPDLAAPEATIKGVHEELQQAITNLTQNAVDAVGKGGHVWVRTRAEARSVRIEVVDDGPGIPREVLARIFTPFFTTKEVGKGMGLGLTITRQVIKQHGGTLNVDSTPGKGTTFTIRLPLASEVLDAQDGNSMLEQAGAEDENPTP
jgi:signal transduction histidine kinase